MTGEDAEEFVRRVVEARAVEVKGSLYLKDPTMMYLMDPNPPSLMRADCGFGELPQGLIEELPLYVICHRSRVAEISRAITDLRASTRWRSVFARGVTPSG